MPAEFKTNLRVRDFKSWVVDYFLSNKITTPEAAIDPKQLELKAEEIPIVDELIDQGILIVSLWDRYYIDEIVLNISPRYPVRVNLIEVLFLFLILCSVIFFLTLLWSL